MSKLSDGSCFRRQDEPPFAGMLGHHPSLQTIERHIQKVAPRDTTVFIHGETGTGKELAAKAIYQYSRRKHRPFVTLHCGALPETLLEAELFGHTRGAFTGATQNRRGRIAEADGGTLFIDEVAEIPLVSQAKLLRFFQFGEYQRLGSDKVEKVDVRIIVATHKDLYKMVKQGTFREDLYYRMMVFDLEMPSLRQRKDDLPLLINHFLDMHSSDGAPCRLTPEAMEALCHYDYPGNVRELSHLIERMTVLANDGLIDVDLLPAKVTRDLKVLEPIHHGQVGPFTDFSKESLRQVRDDATRQAAASVEKMFLKGLLTACKGNMSLAARTAGMQRTYLHRFWAKHFEGRSARDLGRNDRATPFGFSPGC